MRLRIKNMIELRILILYIAERAFDFMKFRIAYAEKLHHLRIVITGIYDRGEVISARADTSFFFYSFLYFVGVWPNAHACAVIDIQCTVIVSAFSSTNSSRTGKM